jgi:signal transduction histidine kinase
MTRRRWWLAALAVVAVVWALGGEAVSISRHVSENHFLDALVGLSFFTAGIIAIDRLFGNVIGPLMVGYAMTWFAGNWSNLDAWPMFVLFVLSELVGTALLAHIFLAYPSGHVRRGFDRAVLWSIYITSLATGLLYWLTWDPRAFGCTACYWTPAVFPSESVSAAALRISDATTLVFVPLFLWAIGRRWWRASRAERRSLSALWVAGTMLAAALFLDTVASSASGDGFSYLLWEIRCVFLISVPLIFVWGLLSTRLARSAVGDLVVELEGPTPVGGLREVLTRTLGDPTLEVAYAIEGEDRWADADGHPVPRPVGNEGAGHRTVTIVERDGIALAALSHDRALDEDLVRSAGAAAGMAIANERLRAQVRAQLEEVRASRQRIVEAGDRERRRVERDLHDGAQQRLVTVSLALAMLRDRDDVDQATRAALGETSAELKRAIAELRDLARGIHPAILSEEGLGAAVESLASRSGVPVRVCADIGERLPGPVEATAYFVVSESLANVAKHAEAGSARVDLFRRNGCLRVEVTDDGRGGADVGRGSGIGGLQDRVAAIGGTLWIESRAGQGTSVFAEIPSDG